MNGITPRRGIGGARARTRIQAIEETSQMIYGYDLGCSTIFS
jgi:hypothetical protein